MANDIFQRLKKNLKHRSKWARKNNFEAYRLYERDIPEYPYNIDIYKDHCVIYFRGNEKIDKDKNYTPQVIEAIKELLQFSDENIFIQSRRVQDKEFQYEKSDEGREIQIKEGTLRFKTILGKYIDTGLFLDHRPLRQELAIKHGHKALNLFCYTGSLSVALAQGFEQVTSVDLSNTYLTWAKENFTLNDIDQSLHEFVRNDVFEYLKNTINNSNTRYDIIVCDPPTFSNSKNVPGTLDIQRDHAKLIDLCIQLLKDHGTLYFSNNLRSFKFDQELKEKYQVKDKSFWSIPDDFKDKKIHQLFEIKK